MGWPGIRITVRFDSLSLSLSYLLPILLLLLLCCPRAAVAETGTAGNQRLILQDEMRRVSIQSVSSYILDTKQRSALEIHSSASEFQPLQDNSFGYSSGVLWVQFDVSNPTGKKQKLSLEYDFPPFDFIDVYRMPLSAGKVQEPERHLGAPLKQGGDRYAFHEREVDYRKPVFTFEHEPNSEYRYLLRLQTSSSLVFSLNAFTGEQLISYIAREQIVIGLYYGIMLAMVVTNLFFLVSTRDKTYLFYIAYIISYVLFQATLNGLTFQYMWPDSVDWANNCLPFFIFLTCIAVLIFCRSFLNSSEHTPGTDRIYWVVVIINAAGLISALFLFDYRINLIASVILTLVTLILVLANGIHTLLLGVRQARFFLAAWILFLMGGGLNVAKSAGLLPDHLLTTYGIQIGSALEVMVLSLGLGDRINQLSASLQKNVKELKAARSESEKVGLRLRSLVQEAEDFIFTLDEAWNFTMVNKAFQRVLKYGEDELLQMNFLELIYNQDWKDSLNKIFVLEKLEELSTPGKSISFQTEFKQKHVMEPRDAQVSLQYLEYPDGRREILGRSNIMTEDVLARYLVKERVEFAIENYVRNAEIISQRLSSIVGRFADADTQMSVRTSLREIIINAIEHGNLEITFDEKTAALEEGSYLQLIEQRRANPEFKNRKVVVEYSINEDRVAFRITDEGNGFDHRKAMKTDEKALNEQFMAHGRGIMMTISTFDIVRYNEKGNRVALLKYFKKRR